MKFSSLLPKHFSNRKRTNMSLSGKVVIVTGGSKGIGKAVSQRLANDGASVVINFGHDASAAEETVKQIGADKAYAVQADVGSIAGVEKLVQATVEKFGKIDVIIPNAGIMPMKTVQTATEADFDRTFALNVKGPFFLAQVSTYTPWLDPQGLMHKGLVADDTHRKQSRTCPLGGGSSSSRLASTVRPPLRHPIHFTRLRRVRSTSW